MCACVDQRSHPSLNRPPCLPASLVGVTTSTVRNPHEFFFDLYHRFLLATNNTLRSMSLQAMAIVYGAYARTIGPFNDMRFMVKMLSSAQTRVERDRYLIFIDKVREPGSRRQRWSGGAEE